MRPVGWQLVSPARNLPYLMNLRLGVLSLLALLSKGWFLVPGELIESTNSPFVDSFFEPRTASNTVTSLHRFCTHSGLIAVSCWNFEVYNVRLLYTMLGQGVDACRKDLVVDGSSKREDSLDKYLYMSP